MSKSACVRSLIRKDTRCVCLELEAPFGEERDAAQVDGHTAALHEVDDIGLERDHVQHRGNRDRLESARHDEERDAERGCAQPVNQMIAPCSLLTRQDAQEAPMSPGGNRALDGSFDVHVLHGSAHRSARLPDAGDWQSIAPSRE